MFLRHYIRSVSTFFAVLCLRVVFHKGIRSYRLAEYRKINENAKTVASCNTHLLGEGAIYYSRRENRLLSEPELVGANHTGKIARSERSEPL